MDDEVKSNTNSILFIVAHPLLERSRANRAITDAVTQIKSLTVHKLYDLYPHFDIDVAYEQSLLRKHKLIVVQHPFYWYNVPPLLKMWQDEVLESGWAYGPGGVHLKGKDFLLSVSTGSARDSYAEGGVNQFPIETLLSPWNMTVNLCNMKWHKPRIFYNAMTATPESLSQFAGQLQAMLEHYSKHGSF
jgi:putative NADPH-quinone reductase